MQFGFPFIQATCIKHQEGKNITLHTFIYVYIYMHPHKDIYVCPCTLCIAQS